MYVQWCISVLVIHRYHVTTLSSLVTNLWSIFVYRIIRKIGRLIFFNLLVNNSLSAIQGLDFDIWTTLESALIRLLPDSGFSLTRYLKFCEWSKRVPIFKDDTPSIRNSHHIFFRIVLCYQYFLLPIFYSLLYYIFWAYFISGLIVRWMGNV